jgi:hypothetical protein
MMPGPCPLPPLPVFTQAAALTAADKTSIFPLESTQLDQSKKAAGVNNISFVLTNTGATGSTNDVAFASKEATTGDPQLVVVP